MGLRDFFKAKRSSKFAGKPTATRTNITDEQIAQNWVLCGSCKERIYREEFDDKLARIMAEKKALEEMKAKASALAKPVVPKAQTTDAKSNEQK